MTNNELMVTIRCITYNHEPFIRQCLEGFVMQKTNFRFEAIVHDDASTDGTATVVREYAEKYPDIIKPIYETENQYSKHDGSLKRIMKEHTHGKYVALCEGDDYWTDPQKLQKQVDFLEAHPDYSMSHTSVIYYYQYVDRLIHSKDIKVNISLNKNGNVALEDILTKYRIQTLSVIYRRELKEKICNEDPTLYTSQYFLMGDTQLWFGLARMGKIHFLPEVTGVYRKHSNSITLQTSNKGRYRFSLSSAEMRYYISLNYSVNDTFKKQCLKNYEKALIQYWRYDPNFKPKFPISIKWLKYKKIKYIIGGGYFQSCKKIICKDKEKIPKVDLSKIIVHIFYGNSYHLTPNLSAGYLKNLSQYNHLFVLYGPNDMDKQKYIALYAQYHFSNYIFCHNLYQFVQIIWKYRKNPIIFHSGLYQWMLLAIFTGCKNINWVCWGPGAGRAVCFIGRHITWLKRFIYNHFKTIVTLMSQDKQSLNKYYHVPAERIKTIPYIGAFGDDSDLYEKLRKEHVFGESGKPLVLLGNNPSNMSVYIELIKRLAIYKGKIKVQCMLNYSLVKNALYNELIKTGIEVFGTDFRANEEFYEFNDYLIYMNKCDIYICGGKNQTGLGAISNCLKLGKKIYITGKNYDWLTQYYKAIVFQSDNINKDLDYSIFVKDLSNQEKEYNISCVTRKSADRITQWDRYLEYL